MTRTYSYHPGGRLLAAVLAFLGLHVVLLTIAVGSSLLQLQLLHRAAQGEEITQEAADSNDQRENAITLVIIAEYLVLGILFLSALSRANANAHALGAEGLEYTPGWTVGWFFVPIMNFFKPYVAVRETWRASVPVERDWRKNRTSYLLPIWWTLWVTSRILEQASRFWSNRAESIAELAALTVYVIFTEIVAIALTCVAARLMYRLYQLQEQRRQMLDAERPHCPECGENLTAEGETCSVCGTVSASRAVEYR